MAIPFEELTLLATIGTGTFGRVKLVHHKPSDRVRWNLRWVVPHRRRLGVASRGLVCLYSG